MTDDDVAFASVRELGWLLRSGAVSPVELTRLFLRRLEAVGRQLNAVVTMRADLAELEANRADQELRAGIDRGPLHGIPYGAKDLLATVGTPTTWGAEPLRDQVFDYDATVVQRLREAGAVLVAKLGMVEIAGGMGYDEPNAAFTGPGLNPWNLSRWSGGSSSGSGAAVAAGAVPFAIGSETNGSITTPSAFCGISGLRPTYGRVSRHGAMVLSWTLDKLGPMCRTADDCGLVLAAIAGGDPKDPSSSIHSYRYDLTRTARRGFRFGLLMDGSGDQPAARASFERSLTLLQEIGAVEPVYLPALPYEAVIGTIVGAESCSAFEDFIASGRTLELAAPRGRVGRLATWQMPAADYLRAIRARRQIVVELEGVMSGFDALVSPTLGVVAPPIGESFETSLGAKERIPIGSAGNLAGMPAISIPNGFDHNNLPTALQLTGHSFHENAILEVAVALQERTEWHVRRPPTGTGPG